jgi:broad specificity phosphatase PhoE
MELILVRHARPERHVVAEGSADPGLHPSGVAGAAALAAWLATEPVDVIAQSPARRAVETAAPLARRRGLTPVTVPDLAEFDAGSSSYIPVEEMRATCDPRWLALRDGRLYGTVDGPDSFRRRVVAAIEELVQANPARKVVVVCHGGVINAYAGHVLGITKPLWFAPAYAGVTRILAARTGRRAVASLNETAHLELDRLSAPPARARGRRPR